MVARGDTSKLSGDLTGAKNMVSTSFGEMGEIIQSKLMGAFTAVAAGMSMLKGIQMAGQLEQNIIAFETLMGSAEKAKGMLEKLSDFAAKTPFRMAGIVQAARGLVMFGEEEDQVMDTLNILGNAAAATSSDFGMLALIFNQVRGVGKLLTQDFRQLSTRGVISLVDIAKHFDVTTEAAQKMLSSGQVSFEDLRAILKGLSSEGGRFENLMEKQSTSLLGLWSTLQEEFEFLMRDIMQTVVPALKEIQTYTIKTIAAFREWVSPGMLTALFAVAGAIGGIKIALIAMTALTSPIGLLVMSIGAVIAAYKALNPEIEKSKMALEIAAKGILKAGDNMRESHADMFSELMKLMNKQELNSKEMERAGNIISTLRNHYGDLGVSLDETTGKIEKQAGAWDKLNEKMKLERMEDIQALYDKYIFKIMQLEERLAEKNTPRAILGDLGVGASRDELNAELKMSRIRAGELKADLEEAYAGKGKAFEGSPEEEEKEPKPVVDLKELGELEKEYDRFRKAEIEGIDDKWEKEAVAFEQKQAKELALAGLQYKLIEDRQEREDAWRKGTAMLVKTQLLERQNFEEKQRKGREAETKSYTQGLMTPVEQLQEKFKKIMDMRLEPKWEARALEQLKSELTPKMDLVVTGQVGFAEFGKRIQDALLKPDDPQKKTAANTKKTTELLETVVFVLEDVKTREGYAP